MRCACGAHCHPPPTVREETGSDVSHKIPSYLTHPMAHRGPHAHMYQCVHSHTVHGSEHTCGHLTHTCAVNHTAHTCIPYAHTQAHSGSPVKTYLHSGTQAGCGSPQDPPGSGSVICWNLSTWPSWLRFVTANDAKQPWERVQVQRKPGFLVSSAPDSSRTHGFLLQELVMDMGPGFISDGVYTCMSCIAHTC